MTLFYPVSVSKTEHRVSEIAGKFFAVESRRDWGAEVDGGVRAFFSAQFDQVREEGHRTPVGRIFSSVSAFDRVFNPCRGDIPTVLHGGLEQGGVKGKHMGAIGTGAFGKQGHDQVLGDRWLEGERDASDFIFVGAVDVNGSGE